MMMTMIMMMVMMMMLMMMMHDVPFNNNVGQASSTGPLCVVCVRASVHMRVCVDRPHVAASGPATKVWVGFALV